MRWYRDSAKRDLDPALFLKAAGAGADTLGKVAQIPLQIDAREARDFKLKTDRMKALTPKMVAAINAEAKKVAAQLGYKGKELASQAKIISADMQSSARRYQADRGLQGRKVTAGAKDRATQASRDNTKLRTSTDWDIAQTKAIVDTNKAYTQKEVAKINKQNKAPVEVVTYDGEGNIITSKLTRGQKRDPMADLSIDDLNRIAKKYRKK